MECRFVVNRNLFAGVYVAQRVKLYVPVENLHVAIGFTRVIDVVRAVAPATSVQTPTGIYRADA